MLTIDGSMGEGGGQVLRSSLALSLITQTPFRITNIRAGRKRPGMLRQHLACVHAAHAISASDFAGAEIGSTDLTFTPGAVHGGQHVFAIGSAGSTSLVFQTVLLPLLLAAKEPSTLTLEGGTHNPLAPPFDYLQHAFLRQLAHMGADVAVELTRYGFYPAGGGAWTATIKPLSTLSRLDLLTRGEIRARRAVALVSQIRTSVALRELDTLSAILQWDRRWSRPQQIKDAHGSGNVILVTVESEHVTEIFTAQGERGVSAERVAEQVAAETAAYLHAEVPVGEHLADQLLLPMALGQGGSFRTTKPSLHCLTQIEVLKLFLSARVTVTQETDLVWRMNIEPAH